MDYKQFPHLVESGIRPDIFNPYIKAGRFKPNEPEELAEAFELGPFYATVGLFLGAFPPLVRFKYLTNKTIKSGFPLLAPKRLPSIFIVPVSSALFAMAFFKVNGVFSTNTWSKLHPEYTTSEVIDKITLFHSIADYARDPNMIRPPLSAEDGRNAVSPPTKESERAANNAIAAEFRRESPFKAAK